MSNIILFLICTCICTGNISSATSTSSQNNLISELARMYKEHSQQSLKKGKQKVDEMKPIPGSMLVSTYQL